MLEYHPVSAFRDNYIWLLQQPGARACVAVDPGDAAPVREYLARNDLALAAILVTHHHPDHVGGVASLVQAFEVPVFGPAGESIPACSNPVSGGDVIEPPALETSFQVIDIPGHTAGHIAYHGGGGLLCGDTLFAVGCGKLFEGTPDQMCKSLDRLRNLPPETAIYCGHEYTLKNIRFALAVEPDNPALQARQEEARQRRAENRPTLPSRIGAELETNPFLRWDRPEIRAAAERHAGHALGSDTEVFAELRRWKDGF
ncbi:MAG TPA: hydroxyacylglutathione hydrolase [Gammaproteobacteria bacterium]|nr:hydroxyacylglutathione hydrolase [Gammaproteobacteria bacterium]